MPPETLDYETPGGGDKSPFEMAIVCPACGKDGAVRGTLVSGDAWHFWPSGMKIPFRKDSAQVEAYSYACVSCGVVTTFVNPHELRRLLGVQEKKPNGTK